jgi:ribosomal protein S18 acetylase RimI-like enzyme
VTPAAIRAAEDADVPALLELWRSDDVHPTVTDNDDAVLTFIAERPGCLLVAASETGQVVGSVLIGWDGWRGSLYRLVVHSRWRRQGIGTDLVRRAVGLLQAKRCHRVSILVVATDAGAVAFWERCGVLGILPDPSPKLRFVITQTEQPE